jgi:hypothetical protein
MANEVEERLKDTYNVSLEKGCVTLLNHRRCLI